MYNNIREDQISYRTNVYMANDVRDKNEPISEFKWKSALIVCGKSLEALNAGYSPAISLDQKSWFYVHNSQIYSLISKI